MSRILDHAKQAEYRTLDLSFHLADREDFQDLTTFLQRFCANISAGLRVPIRIHQLWDDVLGSKMNCRAYFEQYLLPKIISPLVIGLDEVDRIFQYPEIATDFLSLLRAWHEEATTCEIWQRLRLIIVHSTEASIPLDHSQSPFNVGLSVELQDFGPHQVWELVRRYGLG